MGDEEEGGFVDDDGGDGDDDASAMEIGSKDGGGVFIMGMEKDDDQAADPVLELLLPHILDLPAFRARAAGAVRQEPPLAFPRQVRWMHGGAVIMDEEMADELTGRRNPLQLRHTY
ncbi:unnamed protein product [Miscanthus lutarioriparius]|uniref:Uncharacterized protein n=1 Tax=Miscanthus lutarioriparius TaxID=422564 RepID=A0A811SHQ4_9POAL|nr:unnamed protein product [Miscanthus lutarioriparius]